MAALEKRLARVEARLGLEAFQSAPEKVADGILAESASVVAAAPLAVEPLRDPDELEFALGQSWFALAGVLALTMGAGFLLSLPHAGVPRAVPSIAGYAIVAGLLLISHFWQRTIGAVAGPLRGAAMLLASVATLRLFFPNTRAVLEITSGVGSGVLLASIAFNAATAWYYRTPWLIGVALVTGSAAALAAGSAVVSLAGILGLVAFATAASRLGRWPLVGIAAIPVCVGTYLIWALGNPVFGGAVAFVSEPRVAPLVLLLAVGILARGLYRGTPDEDGEEAAEKKVEACAICALGYSVFAAHSIAAFRAEFVLLQTVASLVFLGLAVLSWKREQSHVSTFFYAMTGYAALSLAILKGVAAPDVFVWLSAQSVVVVATAIWFRSRLIVVANFAIYVLIVVGYIATAGKENGISIGFGVVALVTARILNWQQHRLELKTDAMRNAYLLSGFVLFPYALAFLVPGRLVAVAWVGLSLGYYAMNLIVRSPKYRWMGHATLILTMLYLMAAAVRGLEPVYRVLSFLALGVVLLIVSLSFTRARRRKQGAMER